MRVTVKLFAVVRERAGTSRLDLELLPGQTAGQALEVLAETVPQVSDLLRRVAVAVNQEYADRDAVLKDGDELAIIPPVSGGCDPNWIAISPDALPVTKAIESVLESPAGGVAVFLGTTRSEEHADGSALQCLEYEAYEPMALQQMRQLASQARKRWPIVKLALLHRVGRVALAEPSVVIAVSTPHRADAFEACRWLIDSLKKDVAIWKKEVWGDGTSSWVHPESRGA